MKITCALFHSKPETSKKIEAFIRQTPFLSLCGTYRQSTDILSAYYDEHIQLFFIEIEEGDKETPCFCQLLAPPTRIIFLSSDKLCAADCFRMDALDYLLDSAGYPTFLEAANKALRWFSPRRAEAPKVLETPRKVKFIYIKSEYRIVRIDLDEINYIEGLGDYVKIHCNNTSKPVLSLCSMKNLEQALPTQDFIRVHRSYIVRKECISALEHGNIVFEGVNIPIGESYRKRFQDYINCLPIL